MATDDRQRSKKARQDWIQIDALSCGTGWDEKDLTKPQILIGICFLEGVKRKSLLAGFNPSLRLSPLENENCPVSN